MAFLIGAYCLIAALVVWRAIRRQTLEPLFNWLIYQILILTAAVILFPLYWMVSNSLKPAAEALQYPPTWIPDAATAWEFDKLLAQAANNYRDAWNSPPAGLTFSRFFWVSLVTGSLTTAGTLVTSALAAYPLAKMRFAGKSLVFYLVLATLMVPSQVLMIPNYLILERFGWLDRYPALVAPFLASVIAIFLLRQFFMGIPEELWDAAQIDGAGRWTYLWRVLIPLARPVVITVAILTFLEQWNALLWPLIVTTRPEMRTLMVGLQNFNQEAVGDPNLLMAAATFSMAPVVLAFFVLQRFFIQSIARTGLTG